MSNKSERIPVYVTPQTKEAVESEAAANDQSRAEWCRPQIERGLKNEQQERIMMETNAEHRLNQLIGRVEDNLDQQMSYYHDFWAAYAVYAAATFRLLGDYGDYTDPQRKAALDAAADTLGQWDFMSVEMMNRLVNDLAETLDQRDLPQQQQQQQQQKPSKPQQSEQSKSRASESRAEDQQKQQQQQQQADGTLPGQKPPEQQGQDDDKIEGFNDL
jgi:hypothetical protein